MSDIRFNQWLHQSGTGGVSQDHIGNIGIGTTNPSIVVSAANTAVLNVGVITANNLFVNNAFNGDITGNVTGNISGATGTFSGNVDIADKIIHTGDTDTAMRFPADNTFAVDTAGSERLRILANGKIGIGTAVATEELHVIGDIYSDGGYFRTKTGVEGGLFDVGGNNGWTVDQHVLRGYTNGSERVRINSVGNMGIGGAPLPTSTGYDGATLHLYQSAGTGGSSLRMTNGNTGHTTSDGFYMGYWQDGHLYCYNQEAGHIIVGTNGTERFRITSTGWQQSHAGYAGVGINTFASWARTGGAIRAEVGYNAVTTDYMYFGTGTNHPLSLRVNNDNALYIKNDAGRSVGIGTDNPSYKLDVRLTAEDPTTGSPAAGAFSQIRADDATVGKGPSLSLMNLSGSKETGWRISALTASGNNGDFTIHGYNGGATYEERLRIDAAGQLLLGETSAGGACRIGMSFGNSTGNYIEMGGTNRNANGLSKLAVMRHGYWGGSREVGSIGFLTSSSSGGAGRGSSNFVVHTGSSGNGDGGGSGDNLSIERMRIDSGGALYVNTTNNSNWAQTSNNFNTDNSNTNDISGNMCFRSYSGALILANDADAGYAGLYINKFDWSSGDDSRWISFYLNGSIKDSITWNGSNVVYGTGSDYRIKTNIRDFTGGIDLIKQIPVRQYDYIETERGTDHVGFIAHELQEVLPDAVSGEKDGMRIEEETGEEVMNIQNVEYGKVTPLLTAALKEAIAKIETLEARIVALEG